MSKPFEDDKFVAIVHHICPCCGKQDKGDIMLHQRGKDISELHQQNVGFELCEGCKEDMKIAVMFVIIDTDKGGTEMKDWYRTGNIMGLSEAYCRRALPPEMAEDVINKRLCAMDYREAIERGLPVKYTP